MVACFFLLLCLVVRACGFGSAMIMHRDENFRLLSCVACAMLVLIINGCCMYLEIIHNRVDSYV